MKRIKTVGVLCAVSLLAAACSDSGDGGGDGGGQVTITYWHAYNEEGPEAQTLNDVVIPAFEQDHADIDIEAVAFPYDSLRQKLLTSAAGETLPCLVRSDIIWVPELAELGVLAALDQEMDDFDTLAGQTYEGALATNQWQGGYYGLPLDTNTRVLMYNQEALDGAGVAGPPETFADLRELADSLSGSDVSAYADAGTGGWQLLPWIWSAGGQMLSPDQTTATGYLNSPESVAGVQLLVDLHEAGQIPDLIVAPDSGIPTSEGLPQGSYATILDGPWMFPIFDEQYPDFQLQTAPVPAGPAGSVSVVGGEDIAMTASCEDKDQAAEVVRYLLSESAQLEMAKVGQMPVLRDLGSALTDIQDYYGVFAEQLATAQPRPPHPKYTQLEEIMSNEVQRAFQGEASVQAALDTAAQEIDAVLAAG